MLVAVVDVLEAGGVAHFLDYGSALGAWRVRGVLPGDQDADLGVLDGDYARAAALLRRHLPEWLEVCTLPLEERPSGRALVRQITVRRRLQGRRPAGMPAPEPWPSKAAPPCHEKPNIDIYAYSLRLDGAPTAALERADLADRRGPHYGAVPAEVVLPTACACVGGRSFRAPRDVEAYAMARYGCIGVIGLECEQDPTFEGRGIYYQPIASWRNPAEALRSMRARVVVQKV